MTLIEEKKLVAEKLMGWSFIGLFIFKYPKKSDKQKNHPAISSWNPQLERKWWDEIWEREGFPTGKYYDNLLALKPAPREKHIWLHTAKPEVCWKALIKTLEGS